MNEVLDNDKDNDKVLIFFPLSNVFEIFNEGQNVFFRANADRCFLKN